MSAAAAIAPSDSDSIHSQLDEVIASLANLNSQAINVHRRLYSPQPTAANEDTPSVSTLDEKFRRCSQFANETNVLLVEIENKVG